MTTDDIVSLRLANQQLSASLCRTPADVVSWFGAVQAQDFMGGKWAIGLRLSNCSDENILEAIKTKTIVRSWPMRGTLHFVAPSDLRWMLKLLAVRVIPRMNPRFKQLELDEKTLSKGSELLYSMLQGGKSKTRDEIYAVFEEHGIKSANQRGLHIIGKAAHEGLVCFGAPIGKQQTFVLLDEWLPKTKEYSREESLGMIATRYFTSHGPATIADFVWWTGLTVGDARTALELSKSFLVQSSIGGVSYWMGKNRQTMSNASGGVVLLPPFDEYLVGYKDRAFALDVTGGEKSLAALSYLLSPTILIGGRVAGLWRRDIKKDQIKITTNLFRSITATESEQLQHAANAYANFFGKAVICK